MLSYADVKAGEDRYQIPPRFKKKKSISPDRLPYIELCLLELVEHKMGGKFNHPYISLKCWMLGLTPAMSITEAEREMIRELAASIRVSIQSER